MNGCELVTVVSWNWLGEIKNDAIGCYNVFSEEAVHVRVKITMVTLWYCIHSTVLHWGVDG